MSLIPRNASFVGVSPENNEKFEEFLSSMVESEMLTAVEMSPLTSQAPPRLSLLVTPLSEQKQGVEVVLDNAEGRDGKYSHRVRCFHDAVRRTTKQKESLDRLNSVAHQGFSMISSNVGLLILLILYACAGAAIFEALEAPYELELRNKLNESREAFINHVIELVDQLHFSHISSVPVSSSLLLGQDAADADAAAATVDDTIALSNFSASVSANNVTCGSVYNCVNQTLDIYENIYKNQPTQIIKYSEKNLFHGWSFVQALFFCGTVFTTVGYGNVSPVTKEGRVAAMTYAVFGIPLCLIFLSRTGKNLTRAIKFFWSYIRRFYYTGSCRKVRKMIPLSRVRMSVIQRIGVKIRDKSARRKGGILSAELQQLRSKDDIYVPYEVNDKFNLPPVVAIIIAFLYIILGACLYTQWESWTFLEAFYFTFISLSTIGFGDITPEHPKYFLSSSVYLMIGLSLVAMVINVVMEAVSETITKATDQVIRHRRRPADKADRAERAALPGQTGLRLK